MKINNILNIRKSKLRIFSFQTKDIYFALMIDLPSSYLLSLFIEKLGFFLNQFSITYIYPFNKYFDYILPKLDFFDEEYFIFNLENYYHSSDYAYNFLIKILNYYKNKAQKPKIIIHSIKTIDFNIDFIMKEYDFVYLFINTDIEYFFNELFYKNTDISKIGNIHYRDDNGVYYKNKEENVDYDLGDYILGGYYNGYYLKFPKSKDEIASLKLLEQSKNINENIPGKWSNQKYIEILKNTPENSAMLTTGRGCKYNCSYCYRGVKYKKVRQIPLDIIEKDLEYLYIIGYKNIYLYDDCFISTNLDRLDDILKLLGRYDFSYQIASRYETLTLENLKKLSNSNIKRIQVGLQSVSIKSNLDMKRNLNLDGFKKTISIMRIKGIDISIDLILGLPGESIKDYIKALNFAISLKPNSIYINKLFLNPKTELNENKYNYKIITTEDNSNIKNDFYVPKIFSSNTFSEKDFGIAEKYTLLMINKYKNILIILR